MKEVSIGALAFFLLRSLARHTPKQPRARAVPLSPMDAGPPKKVGLSLGPATAPVRGAAAAPAPAPQRRAGALAAFGGDDDDSEDEGAGAPTHDRAAVARDLARAAARAAADEKVKGERERRREGQFSALQPAPHHFSILPSPLQVAALHAAALAEDAAAFDYDGVYEEMAAARAGPAKAAAAAAAERK